jgi:hypothetical protein
MRLSLAVFSLCANLAVSGSALAGPINVLWYTYAHPLSQYSTFFASLSGTGPGSAASYSESRGLEWNVTLVGPTSAAPTFANYDVLAIHSGEAFRTGAPDGPNATPDYAWILDNRSAIEAARGSRTFISGSDADHHASRGDSGHCSQTHCGAFDGARGYVINAVNWAASGAGLGIVSFFHGEFGGAYWWDHPRSFLRAELQGNWFNLSSDENNAVIPASAAGYEVNEGLTSAGLSNWINSFHGGFSNVPGYASTVVSGSRQPGAPISIATIDLCRPFAGRYCVTASVEEPPTILLLVSSSALCLIGVVLQQRRRRCAASTNAHTITSLKH